MTLIADSLPSPLGGSLVWRVKSWDAAELAASPTLELGARNLADLESIATGVYSPLTGFLDEADYLSVIHHMRLANGLPWSVVSAWTRTRRSWSTTTRALECC